MKYYQDKHKINLPFALIAKILTIAIFVMLCGILLSSSLSYENKELVIGKYIPVLSLASILFIIFLLLILYYKFKETRDSRESVKHEKFLLDILLDSMPDNIYFKDIESKFIMVNKATLKKFGFNSNKTIIGKTDADLFGKTHTIQALEDEKSIMKTGVPILNQLESEDWQDGNTTWAITSKFPLKSRTGEIIGTYGFTRDVTEQKRAELELINSQQKLKLALESTKITTYSWDINTDTITWGGERVKDVFGRDAFEIKSFDDYIATLHPDDIINTKTAINNAINSDESIDIDFRIVTPDDEIKYLIAQGIIIKNVNGESEVMHGVVFDVTDRKEAEIKLYESEARLKAVISNAPLIIFSFDKFGKLDFIEGEALDTIGWATGDMIGNNIFDIFKDSPEILKSVEKSLLGKQLSEIVSFSELYFNLKFVPIFKNSWDVESVICVGFDITDQYKATQQLQQSEENMRNIIEAAPVGMLSLDSDGNIVFVNRLIEKLFEYDGEELLGKNIDLLMPERFNRMLGIFKRYITSPRKLNIGRDTELTGLTKSGREFPVEIGLSPLETYGQNVVIAGVIDITFRKKAEQALLEAKVAAEDNSRAKSDFLANMSHELRTPLNAILGYAQILGRDDELNNSQQKAVKTIKNSGEHLLDLINDILDLSKIEARKFEIHYETFDLSNLIGNVVDIIRVKANQKGLEFGYNKNDEMPKSVTGDPRIIKQILFNIIGNAIKFTEDGSVILDVYREENLYKFRISDTGIGIPEDKINEIFEPFKQTGQREKKSEGTGLGLAITKRFAEMLGGNITVTSTEGKGSIFTVTLKLDEEMEIIDNPVNPNQKVEGYHGDAKTILAADDNRNNLAILIDCLEPLGFNVVTAANGLEAYDNALEHKPDLILMDMVMPVMDGFESTRRIKDNPASKQIPVIALSASVMDTEQETTIASGCDAFLPKPVIIDELLNVIASRLSLQWKYKKQPIEVTNENEMIGNKNVVRPPKDIIDKITRAADIGDFAIISEVIEYLNNDEYQFFKDKINSFIETYDEDGILDFINELN